MWFLAGHVAQTCWLLVVCRYGAQGLWQSPKLWQTSSSWRCWILMQMRSLTLPLMTSRSVISPTDFCWTWHPPGKGLLCFCLFSCMEGCSGKQLCVESADALCCKVYCILLCACCICKLHKALLPILRPFPAAHRRQMLLHTIPGMLSLP